MVKKFAKAVIGAGYGDEGKGLMTDFHANAGASLVVRSNGGAQAGHTVTTPDGRRHVFHHFGSGAFAGLATHLSSYFVMNPIVFFDEAQELVEKSCNTVVTGSLQALVTTPYDMIINQIVETVRGQARHGSCGIGIGETEERSLRPNYTLRFGDLFDPAFSRRDFLQTLRDKWVPERLQILGVETIPDKFKNVLKSDDLIDNFDLDCRLFSEFVRPLDDVDLPTDILFEGAQGLLLDQTYGAFPHVTRSNTGLCNMVSIARSAGITDIDVTYATRSYVTRHGAGPLSHEGANMDWLDMVDETNQPNAWQGTIRKAPLDVDVLRAAVEFDLKYAADLVVKPVLSISCLDQIVGQASIISGNAAVDIAALDIPEFVQAKTDIRVGYAAMGPTRKTISSL